MKKKLLGRKILKIVAGITASSICLSSVAEEEDASAADQLEEITITGTRITTPGTVSSSPIFSVDETAIDYLQEPELERVLRTLPSVTPGDGSNVNNDSAGAATIDLRGMGPERTLVLMNGRRMVPFNYDGEVDIATIPTALVERVDVLTGGASAVYGSDAVTGAVNFILKNDFEGVELDVIHSQTAENDGEVNSLSLTVGSDVADGQGNFAASFSWMEREAVLLEQRPLGLLGIDTASGANLEEFRAGLPPAPPPAGCGGPNVAASGGSTTAIPTRFAIVGGGDAASGQFREDGTIGDECSVFNYNPFNYYQTPLQRYSATAIGSFEFTEDHEVYTQFNFTNTTVVQQVAPSGTFGQPFNLPIGNPFIGDQARQFMIDAGNTSLANGLLSEGTGAADNWQDVNGNGVVDEADYLRVQLRRRTLELGPRSEKFDGNQFQIVVGFNGTLLGDWTYDASFQYGESNRTTVRDGYTNLTNIQNALDTTDGVTCANGDPTCVPIDLFGGFGTITPEMAPYARAIALQQQKYEQTVATAFVQGPVDFIHIPTAEQPLTLLAGLESREEIGKLTPDECLKLAPASCQGGAGGNLLPIEGGYKVEEVFFEGILPIAEGIPGAESLSLEVGYRYSDYDISGSNDTWKLGLTWSPIDQLMARVGVQQATRAPNVGEIASPVVTGLDNAKQDPCSVANADNIDAELRALCISTGMSDAQVGAVQNVIAGQVNTIQGSDPNNLPGPEKADTFTAGFVWTPDFAFSDSFQLNLDYYDIKVNDVIEEFSAQEVLDRCYQLGVASECAKIRRVGGDLTISGAGVERFTTNLDYKQAEGIEVAFNIGFGLGQSGGDLEVSGMINHYLTQESRSTATSPVLDCKGFYGTSCDPLSDLRWVQRTTWHWNDFSVSAQWRHIGAVDIEEPERDGAFEDFRSIEAYNYFDLYASYNWNNSLTFSLGIDNVTDQDPPVVGNEAGDTSSNSGNTFPSNYDVLGTIYTLGMNVKL